MFPDSKCVKLFSLGPDKMRYSCNFGLAPYFRKLLHEKLDKSEIHVLSFDESLNNSNQKCQMDLIAWYWDVDEQRVKVKYYKSSYLGHTTHAKSSQSF